MKNINLIMFFLVLQIINCTSFKESKIKVDENNIHVIFQSKFYKNSMLVGEKHYNSKNGKFKISETKQNTSFDKEIIIKLTTEDLKKIYSKYKELKIPNKKLCLQMKDEGNNVVIERVILINSENDFTLNDCAITDNDQKNLSYITSMLLNLLTSKPEYKKAFPMAEWEL